MHGQQNVKKCSLKFNDKSRLAPKQMAQTLTRAQWLPEQSRDYQCLVHLEKSTKARYDKKINQKLEGVWKVTMCERYFTLTIKRVINLSPSSSWTAQCKVERNLDKFGSTALQYH